ncbi:MAG TPA: bifunctional lysylphosphatidylglycerol flippase/synthetase MprF [Longimicrobium sp.]
MTPLFGIALFAFALWLLHRELRNYHYADLARELRNIPRARLFWGVALTLVSYAVMTLYDALGVRYVRRRLSYGRIAMASLVGYGISMTLGFPLLTGAPLRYRMYSRWGLSAGEIARIIGFYSTTFWLGVLSVGGLSFLLDPPRLPPDFPVDHAWLRPIGALLLVALVAYLALSALGARITVRGYRIELPSLWMAIAQVLSSSLDWVLAAAVLYVLLPSSAPSFPAFFGIFLAGQILGHASHVPGGLGVFESVMLFFLTPRVPAPVVVGALLAWRAIYYLLPLALAVVTLAGHELRRLHTRMRGPEPMAASFSAMAPQLLAVTTFFGGTILLFSGATPIERSRLGALHAVIPLPVSELAHLLASVAGVMLLLLARGVQMRLHRAWRWAALLLAAGILLSLAKGLDYEEAGVLTALLVPHLASRSRFHRRAPVLDEPFTAAWLAAIGVVLTATAWLGFFAYKHVRYGAELWLRFAPDADASRFLRSCAAIAVVLAAFFAAHLLLRRRHAPPHLPTGDELARARAVIAASPRAEAHLALLGDKPLIFSPSQRSFVMYGTTARSWVALGDPVGPPEEREELAWRFREEADRRAASPVFYQVDPECLPIYTDMGLTVMKVGEEAVVKLDEFTLEGDERRALRRTWKSVRRHGVTFELVPAEDVPALLPELRAVSDEWLARKRTREKGFSMGRFDPAYLAHFPHAVARLHGRVIAFATVWLAAEGTEMTVDLVRWSRLAPPSVMEFLFVELMRWGCERGWREFNLGMAPLPGLQKRELAAVLFRHGEHFRDLHGLRRYKEKFGAEWRLKYLAAPGGLALPRILADVAELIAGNDGDGDKVRRSRRREREKAARET